MQIRHQLLLLGLALVAGCTRHGSSERPELTLYCAASLREAMDEVSRVFTEETGISMLVNYAGSGALAQQILAAPRADLFLSANSAWMDRLEEAGMLEEGSRLDLLGNRLVIIARRGTGFSIPYPGALPALPFRHLSVGDPESVPAGTYARRWLQQVQLGDGTVWDAVHDRLILATDVRAALAHVEANADTVGIVYRTDYLSRPDNLLLLLEAPGDANGDIRYPVAVIKTSLQLETANAFLDFLQTDGAAVIFRRHGFVTISQNLEEPDA